jgi:hypothetical protein
MRHEVSREVGLPIAQPLLAIGVQSSAATSALVDTTGMSHRLAPVRRAAVVAESTVRIAPAADDDLRAAARALEHPGYP